MARESKQDKLDKVHKEALARFDLIVNAERDNRKLAVEDAKFAHLPDGQWDEDAIAKRADRPRYTINRVAGAIDQLVGDQRQNRTSIKVRPVSGGANADQAKIFSGLIRNIEAQSKAENAYDSSFDEAITGGYGCFRVLTEFTDDDIFEQDIKIKPLDSASTSLWFDPSARDYDKRDATYAFVTRFMTDEAFKLAYPGHAATSFDVEQFNNNLCKSWFANDRVRIAEYWVKVPVTKEIGLMSNGDVIDLTEEAAVLDELAEQGVTVTKTRKVKSHKVVMYIMSGSELLSGAQDWAGKFIPLIPVFGKVTRIEGQEYVRGLVRPAKDPQRIYNYSKSAAIEATALSPKDPIWITAKQAKGYEGRLKNFNIRNDPFMLYNSDDAAPGAPQRTGAPALQSALIQQEQQAAMDIYATTGMSPPSLGATAELKSGKAIQSEQRMGDRGSFIYTDNLHKSIEYAAEILIDLIPRIYDTERIIRVLNIDGTSEEVTINAAALNEFNQRVVDQETGKEVIVNDLTVGKYDAVVEAGASFNTQRQESAQQLIELATGSAVFEELSIDLIAKNLNLVEGEELTKRLRKRMIQQGIAEPTDEEIEELGLNEPQQPDPNQLALLENVQMQTQDMISKIEERDAKTDKILAGIRSQNISDQGETVATLQKLVDTLQTQMEAGIPVTAQEHDMRIKQNDIVVEGQQALDEGPNSEQAADIVQSLQQQQGQEVIPQ